MDKYSWYATVVSENPIFYILNSIIAMILTPLYVLLGLAGGPNS